MKWHPILLAFQCNFFTKTFPIIRDFAYWRKLDDSDFTFAAVGLLNKQLFSGTNKLFSSC
jgi:hypothetical protein